MFIDNEMCPKDQSSDGAKYCKGIASVTFRSSGAAKVVRGPLAIDISSLRGLSANKIGVGCASEVVPPFLTFSTVV